MLWQDPIVEELHKIREEHAAQFHHDIEAMLLDLQEKEKQSGVEYVSFDPKLPQSPVERKPKRKREKVLA